MIIRNVNYLGVNEVIDFLGMGNKNKNNFYQYTTINRLKDVEKIKYKNVDYYRYSDLRKLQNKEIKVSNLMINAQRMIMLIQSDTMASNLDLCVEMGFKDKAGLNKYLLQQQPKKEDNQVIVNNVEKFYPKIYGEYMKEYVI